MGLGGRLVVLPLLVAIVGCAKGSTDPPDGSTVPDLVSQDAASVDSGPQGPEGGVCTPECLNKCGGDSDGCGGTCPPGQCPGCCEGTLCRTGTDDTACGIAGAACQDCSGVTSECGSGVCVAGACSGQAKPDQTPCTDGKCYGGACCAGCWDNSACQQGTTVDQCGIGGAGCLDCDDGEPCTQDTCESGGCVTAVAPAGTPCQGGTCQGGICCTGCWDNAQCEGGTSTTFCGQGGAACQACTSTDPCEVPECQNGACQLQPSPDQTPCPDGQCYGGACCTGCVSGGSCQPGNTTAACGVAAAPCASCTSGRVCTGGKCVWPPLTHNGCASVNGVGCGGCACEACVCAMDSFCCATKWDSICANECKQCNTGDGCSASPISCPGCGGCACEACVCAMDSFCCDTTWDSICANECQTDCGGCP